MKSLAGSPSSRRIGALLYALCFAVIVPASGSGGIVPRGDANNDGKVDLSDAILIFQWLAESSYLPLCLSAVDANLDGKVDYSDGIYLLQYMFLSGDEPLPFHPGLAPGCYSNNANYEVRNLRDAVLSPASAMISWETAFPSDTVVYYGLEEKVLRYRLRVEESVYHHQALLEGLEPNTTYFYLVTSATDWGEEARSEIRAFTTLSDIPIEVRKSRPRLLLGTDDLKAIRARVRSGGTHANLWQTLVSWCESRLTTPVEDILKSVHLRDHARALAFVGLVGDVAEMRKKAIEIAVQVAKTWPGENIRHSSDSLAYVYDWLWGYLSAEDKRQIATGLVKACKAFEIRVSEREFVTGWSHGDNRSFFLAALALYGDDSRAEGYLARALWNYRYGFLATWRRFAGWEGGGPKGWWYTTYNLPYELEFFTSWKIATGQDLFQTERVWFETLLDWFLFGLRADGTFFPEGDVYLGTLSFENRLYGELLAKEYGNPQGQWLAERARAFSNVWGPHAVFDILWWDPSVAPQPPVGSLSRWFRSAGVVVCRDSWEPDSTVFKFRSAEAYTIGHAHLDNCSFSIFYKAPLALDTGLYDEFDGEHYLNYYSRTIAHNSMLVFDPSEVFTKWGKTYANDGGQRWLLPGVDVPITIPAKAEDTVDRERGYRLGGIFRYEDEPLYTYAAGDGGPAYSPQKVEKFHRHVLFLRKVAGRQRPVIVIFDDVVSAKSSFRKAYLLHTKEKPKVDGLFLTAVNKDAALHQWTVLPADAEISLVGGPGKEYFVNGVNYPPARKPKDTEVEAEGWRVEVSPRGKRKADHFLHVLFPDDAGGAPPAKPEVIAAGNLQGVRIGDRVVLFGREDELLLAEYEVDRAASHLICGAIPFVRYEIHLDGKLFDSAVASFSGVLRFDLSAGGSVLIVAKE